MTTGRRCGRPVAGRGAAGRRARPSLGDGGDALLDRGRGLLAGGQARLEQVLGAGGDEVGLRRDRLDLLRDVAAQGPDLLADAGAGLLASRSKRLTSVEPRRSKRLSSASRRRRTCSSFSTLSRDSGRLRRIVDGLGRRVAGDEGGADLGERDALGVARGTRSTGVLGQRRGGSAPSWRPCAWPSGGLVGLNRGSVAPLAAVERFVRRSGWRWFGGGWRWWLLGGGGCSHVHSLRLGTLELWTSVYSRIRTLVCRHPFVTLRGRCDVDGARPLGRAGSVRASQWRGELGADDSSQVGERGPGRGAPTGDDRVTEGAALAYCSSLRSRPSRRSRIEASGERSSRRRSVAARSRGESRARARRPPRP